MVSDRLKDQTRYSLMRLGYKAGAATRKRLQTLHRYTTLGAWADSIGELPPHEPSRFVLFERAIGLVTGSRPVYLEFGVYEGDTFRWWCEHLPQPEARLVGFDSFEGLPEAWNEHLPAGAFAVDTIPRIDDPRASFQVGWFEDTLRDFVVPEHDQLIINIDSDLYSSAVEVLRALEPHIVPGTILYFDELSDVEHEFRALQEFLQRTGVRLEALGTAGGGLYWLFRVV